MPRTIAIIPVGSEARNRDFPGRTEIEFQGLTLGEWAVELALATPIIDQILVTTDSEEIAACCRRPGVEVLKRDQLTQSGNVINTTDEGLKVLYFLESRGDPEPDLVVLLQANNVFRTPKDIEKAVVACRAEGVEAVVTVAGMEPAYHPEWAHRINENGMLEGYLQPSTKDMPKTRRELSKCWYRDGSIYVAKAKAYREHADIFRGLEAVPQFMPDDTVNIKKPRNFREALGYLEDNPEFCKVMSRILGREIRVTGRDYEQFTADLRAAKERLEKLEQMEQAAKMQAVVPPKAGAVAKPGAPQVGGNGKEGPSQ